MKNTIAILTLFFATATFISCSGDKSADSQDQELTGQEAGAGQSAVSDDVSQRNVVHVAIGSADHTTLVAAVKAASLVDALSNVGPFTVFAPTNAAFDALPKGTVENLLKPENKSQLEDILQYHVSLGTYTTEQLTDGRVMGQVNGSNVTFTQKNGKVMINGATIIASVPASNGIVHVIDAVILPPSN